MGAARLKRADAMRTCVVQYSQGYRNPQYPQPW